MSGELLAVLFDADFAEIDAARIAVHRAFHDSNGHAPLRLACSWLSISFPFQRSFLSSSPRFLLTLAIGSRPRQERGTPQLRSSRLHAALDFVSNKSRGLRNLAYDLALMQTVSRLPGPPLSPLCRIVLHRPFFSSFLLSPPPLSLSFSFLPLLSRRPDAHRLYFTSRLGKKDKVLMSDTISI